MRISTPNPCPNTQAVNIKPQEDSEEEVCAIMKENNKMNIFVPNSFVTEYITGSLMMEKKNHTQGRQSDL